jgi:hypothetical protein
MLLSAYSPLRSDEVIVETNVEQLGSATEYDSKESRPNHEVWTGLIQRRKPGFFLKKKKKKKRELTR